MSAISIEKWQTIMRMPKFMDERIWRWRAQRDAYDMLHSPHFPPSEWVQKDRILYPLNKLLKDEHINAHIRESVDDENFSF